MKGCDFLKEKLYETLENSRENKPQSKLGKIVNVILIALILMTLAAIILQSFKSINDRYSLWFSFFEIFTVIVFSIEYLARVYISDFKNNGEKSLKCRIKYILTPMAIVDLLAILPFFIPFIIPLDLRFLRLLRLTRILRLFKLNRYSSAMRTITIVIKSKRDELLSSVIIMLFVLLFASILMYYVENPTQPEAFSNMGESFWWAICTLTTVGYGDVYPITPMGRIIASVITVLGIGIIALPTAIISSGFLELLQKKKEKKCPVSGTIRYSKNGH